MILATGIEVASGGAPSSALGKALGALHGTGRIAMATQESLPSIASGAASGKVRGGAESFRTGWQSLLVSLVSGMDSLSASETESDRVIPVAVSARAKAAEDTSGPASTLNTVAGLRVRFDTEKEIAEAGAGAKPASTKTLQRKPTVGSAGEETKIPRSASFLKAAKYNVVAIRPMPGAVPPVVAIAPQDVQVPLVVGQVVSKTKGQAQSAHTHLIAADPSAARPSGSASHSLSSLDRSRRILAESPEGKTRL